MAEAKIGLLILVISSVTLSLQLPGVEATGRASLGTFNTFLFRGAPAFQERKNLLIQTLQARQRNRAPGILCLQELFRATDAQDVAEALTEQYPYQASFADLSGAPPSPQPACTIGEVQGLLACATSLCSHLSGMAFLNCTAVECQDVTFQLTTSCRLCIGAESGAAEEDDAFTRCASVVPASEYEAPFGLLLLSRYKLTEVTTVDFLPGEPVPLVRGYITAKVQVLNVTVLCTHLTAEPDALSYVGPPQFPTASQQQADEIKQIHELVEDESRIVLLGDFNHGPATPGLSWELPLNYGLMTARGLFSANSLWCGQCTFCPQTENVLTGSSLGLIVDHVYLPTGRISAVLRVERIFDTILTPSGLPLSDHYGVSALVQFRRGKKKVCPNSGVLGRNVDFLDLDDIASQVEQFCPA